jgi:NadR type nicotinamide-nucleotide adenylyltransferase
MAGNTWIPGMEANLERSGYIVKIAVVGPESTGKSTISAQLAAHYQTVWVPEYARGYCEKLTEPCSWQDEINMFYGQLALEKELMPLANKLLFCDTTFLTVKIWSDHMFGKAPSEVLEELPRHSYDFYLLLDIDTPWENDPLREFPHLRTHFMNVWHAELKALHADYQVISGLGDTRLEHAISAIDTFLSYRKR